MNQKTQTVYVHAQGHDVWCSLNLGAERSFTSLRPQDLVPCYSHVDRIMLLGDACNAEYIVELSRLRLAGMLQPQVFLCSPTIRGADPASTIANMRAMNLHGSLGGWHELSEHDGPSYALAVALQMSGGQLSSAVSEILRMHRAWPALGFVADLDETSAAQLLAELLDPRWFVDPDSPNSLKRLFAYLGLNPRNVEDALAGLPPRTNHARRCAIVLNCWWRPGVRPRVDDPGCFLQWLVDQGDADHKIKWFLAACRQFVEFVRDVWLHMMAPPGRCLFVPRYFFPEPVARQFTEHLAEFACWRSS